MSIRQRSLTAAALLLPLFALEVLARAATGDFDADGRDELLLRHDGTAAWVYYDIENGVGRRQELALDAPGADHFAALADLNGDGRDDILMRAYDTHAWSWHVMGERAAERRDLPTLTRNPLFTFQAAGDFDGDGDDDVLLRNSSTGQFVYYESRFDAQDPQATLRRGLGLTANLLFEVIATGDLNGDGRDDVLMRHARLGHWIHYEMSRERGVLRRPSPRFTQNLLFEFAGIGDLDGGRRRRPPVAEHRQRRVDLLRDERRFRRTGAALRDAPRPAPRHGGGRRFRRRRARDGAAATPRLGRLDRLGGRHHRG
ncbi:MAG: VCBS repeat-containing protein [Gammaproteobacteria bacterium]|nr:VCBS repeat-containing protein [Gammaproteobacteria bacterium]